MDGRPLQGRHIAVVLCAGCIGSVHVLAHLSHKTDEHRVRTAAELKQGDCAIQALPAWPNVLSTGTRPQPVNGQPLTNGSASQAAAEPPAQSRPGVPESLALHHALMCGYIGCFL